MGLNDQSGQAEDEKLYRRAKQMAQNIRGFYLDLALYIVITPMLVLINLHYTPKYNWFWFSMAGWGIGLIFHAMEAFDLNYFYGRKWEERKIKRILSLQNNTINSKTNTMERLEESEQMRYERAKKRVQAISGFYKHLAAYILINLFLMVVKAVNLEEGEKFFVIDNFKTPIFWGIGLAFHAMGVFYNQVFFGKNWEDRKIRELMEKDKKHRWE